MGNKHLPTTHMAFVVDASSSIQGSGLTDKMIQMVNADIDVAKAMTDHEITVTIIVFANYARIARDGAGREIRGVDPESLQHMTRRDYVPQGMTALFDGVKLAIETLSALPRATLAETSFLVKVVTDGEENQSSFKARAIGMMNALASDERWTFAFALPRGAKREFCRNFSVHEGNVAEWEQTERGAEQVTQVSTAGLSNFLVQRTKGVRSTRNYFEVNAAALTQKLVKGELKDRSADFRLYSVDKAWATAHGLPEDKLPIKEYVESVTCAEYVTGSTYYRLEKKEKVQGGKRVAMMRKGRHEVYTGDEARGLLGLTPGQDMFVIPGDFGAWDIFIQSTSPNRNLRAGSVILIDVTMAPHQAVAQTWDTSVVPKCPKNHMLIRHPEEAKRATFLYCRFCKTDHVKPAPPVQASPQLKG